MFEKGIGEFVLETYMKKNNITFEQARRQSIMTPAASRSAIQD